MRLGSIDTLYTSLNILLQRLDVYSGRRFYWSGQLGSEYYSRREIGRFPQVFQIYTPHPLASQRLLEGLLQRVEDPEWIPILHDGDVIPDQATYDMALSLPHPFRARLMDMLDAPFQDIISHERFSSTDPERNIDFHRGRLEPEATPTALPLRFVITNPCCGFVQLMVDWINYNVMYCRDPVRRVCMNPYCKRPSIFLRAMGNRFSILEDGTTAMITDASILEFLATVPRVRDALPAHLLFGLLPPIIIAILPPQLADIPVAAVVLPNISAIFPPQPAVAPHAAVAMVAYVDDLVLTRVHPDIHRVTDIAGSYHTLRLVRAGEENPIESDDDETMPPLVPAWWLPGHNY